MDGAAAFDWFDYRGPEVATDPAGSDGRRRLEAGVSVMTVSRVLNDFPGVADETRRRVERAIAALDYQANTAARSWRVAGQESSASSPSRPSSSAFARLVRDRGRGTVCRADAQFRNHGAIGCGHGDDLDRLRASTSTGVIVVAPVREVVEATNRIQGDLPVVVVGSDLSSGSPTVTIDQEEGARRATQHLLDLGHRTVHHVCGPKNSIDAAARYPGLVRELTRQECPRPQAVASAIGAPRGDWLRDSGSPTIPR